MQPISNNFSIIGYESSSFLFLIGSLWIFIPIFVMKVLILKLMKYIVPAYPDTKLRRFVRSQRRNFLWNGVIEAVNQVQTVIYISATICLLKVKSFELSIDLICSITSLVSILMLNIYFCRQLYVRLKNKGRKQSIMRTYGHIIMDFDIDKLSKFVFVIAYFKDYILTIGKTSILVLLIEYPVLQLLAFNFIIFLEAVFVEHTELYGGNINENTYKYRERLAFELLFYYHIVCMSSFTVSDERKNNVATSAIILVLIIIIKSIVSQLIKAIKGVKSSRMQKILKKKQDAALQFKKENNPIIKE